MTTGSWYRMGLVALLGEGLTGEADMTNYGGHVRPQLLEVTWGGGDHDKSGLVMVSKGGLQES